MEYNQAVVLTLETDKLVDPDARIEYAAKVLEVVRSLTTPSTAGFAFSGHQRIELQKLLLAYEADLTKFEVYGSENPKEAVRQLAKIEASIELLNCLLNSK